NFVAAIGGAKNCGRHRLLRTARHNDAGPRQIQMRILLGDLIAQRRNSGMRRIAVLLIACDAGRFVPYELRCRKVRFAKSEVYRIRQRPLKELSDQRWLQPAHPRRQLKIHLFNCWFHSLLHERSSSRSSRMSPTSILNSPSACASGSAFTMPASFSISPSTFCPRPETVGVLGFSASFSFSSGSVLVRLLALSKSISDLPEPGRMGRRVDASLCRKIDEAVMRVGRKELDAYFIAYVEAMFAADNHANDRRPKAACKAAGFRIAGNDG